MTVPGRLQVAADGRVTGPAAITHNVPFPTIEGTPGGGSASMMGVVMHTEVGYDRNVITEFNSASAHASAFFSIADNGAIHQYGPVGKNWMAWAQVAGNPEWYSIEHEDNGDQHNPLTPQQIVASAQLVELLSRFAGFPLQVTDSVTVKGYGTHVMGGAAWGGHTCPGPGPRAAQRAEIISLAKVIRVGLPPAPTPPPPPPPPPVVRDYLVVSLPDGATFKGVSGTVLK